MLHDTTTPDGYQVGSDGAWVTDSNAGNEQSAVTGGIESLSNDGFDYSSGQKIYKIVVKDTLLNKEEIRTLEILSDTSLKITADDSSFNGTYHYVTTENTSTAGSSYEAGNTASYSDDALEALKWLEEHPSQSSGGAVEGCKAVATKYGIQYSTVSDKLTRGLKLKGTKGFYDKLMTIGSDEMKKQIMNTLKRNDDPDTVLEELDDNYKR